jgi:hypothetical protein
MIWPFSLLDAALSVLFLPASMYKEAKIDV